MQRSSSAGPVLVVNGRDKHKNKIRIEQDYQNRYQVKTRKPVKYEQIVGIAQRRLTVGNPILRAAMERDKFAEQLERRNRDFSAVQYEMRCFEINAMYAEANPYHY